MSRMSVELAPGLYGGLRGRDPHDSRDYLFALNTSKFGVPLRLPSSVLLPYLPPVRDQQSLGSCTAFSAAANREILTLKIGHTLQPLSQLWVYYETRRKFWDVNEDSGAYMREVTAILAGRGAAREADWPYDVSKWNVNPPSASYGPAIWYRNVNYYRINTLSEMLSCLAAGWPFIFGFAIHPNFWDAQDSGNVPMPDSLVILGGHANCAIGYVMDDAWAGGGYIIGRNSWWSWTHDVNLRFPFAFLDDPDTLMDVWAFHLKSEDA